MLLEFLKSVASFPDLKQLSDKNIVEGCLDGKKRYEEELFKRHGRLVYMIAFRKLKNKEDAEDIVQETFRRVHQYLDTLREKEKIKSWIAMIAVNASLQMLKSKGFNQSKGTLSIDYLNTDEHSENYGNAVLELIDKTLAGQTANHLIVQEAKKEIRHAITTLRDNHREAIELWLSGLEYKEISEITNTKIGTVKSRINTARDKIEALVTAKYNIDRKR